MSKLGGGASLLLPQIERSVRIHMLNAYIEIRPVIMATVNRTNCCRFVRLPGNKYKLSTDQG